MLRGTHLCASQRREKCVEVLCVCVCVRVRCGTELLCDFCMFLCFHMLKKVNLWKFHMVHPKMCMFQSEVMCR